MAGGYSFARNAAKFAAGLATFRKKGGKKTKFTKKRKHVRRRKFGKFRRRSRGGSVKLRGDDIHSGLSSNWVNITLGKKLKGRTVAKYQFLQNYSGVLTAYAGNQGAAYFLGLATKTQMVTSSSTPNAAQVRTALFDLDPNQTNTGGNFVPTVAQPANQKLALYNVRANMMFTNFDTAAVTLVLYFVTPRMSSEKNAYDCWGDGYTTMAYGKASRTRAASGAYGSTTAGAGDRSDLFSKPTDTIIFNKYYKVCKVHKIQLAGGSTEEVNLHLKINKIIQKDKINESSIENYRGINMQVLAVWYGQPILDKKSGGVGQNVTCATTNIGYITTVKYNLGALKSTIVAGNDYFVNNQLAYATAVNDQYFVNVADQIVAVAQNV